MTDAVEVIREEPEPVETPTQLPTDTTPIGSGADYSDLDRLLEEYDSSVRPTEPEPQQLPASETAAPVQDDASGELDKLLAEISGTSTDTQRADALQGQLSELQAQVRREQDWREFESYSDDLQKQAATLSPHIDENFVRLRLESAAHNKEIALAWDTRHINPADAARDLAYVEHSLRQLQSDPNADRGQIQQLQTLAYQLNIAANSPSILRRLRNTILTEAKNSKPPYDADATQTRGDVAWAVRQARSGDIPEPKPNLGTMTDAEFRNYTKRNFGF